MTEKTETGAKATEFDALLAEITEVAKAVPAEGAEVAETAEGDKRVAAAAADGEDEGDDDEDGAEVGKSFEVVLADGSKAQAFDGAAMLKSLADRDERIEKALGDVFNIVKSQAAEIKALKLAGRGRKSVVTIAEKKPTEVAKALTEEGPSHEEFMAKALEAQIAGRISGFELTKAENLIAIGKQPSDEFKRAVLGNGK